MFDISPALVDARIKELLDRSVLDPATRLLCMAGSFIASHAPEKVVVLKPWFEKHAVSHREITEAVLQCYLFTGFPPVIEAFHHLESVAPVSRLEPYNVEKYRSRGLDTCRIVYGKNFTRLLPRMKELNADLAEWMIIEGYGKVLSRPGLPLKTRELINIAVLAAGDWPRQLHSHVLGAYHAGASAEEIREVVRQLDLVCDQDTIERAQRLADVILEKRR